MTGNNERQSTETKQRQTRWRKNSLSDRILETVADTRREIYREF